MGKSQPRAVPVAGQANGNGVDLAAAARFRAGYEKGKAEAAAVHLRIIAALVAQLDGQAVVPDVVLVDSPLAVRTWRDETVPGWVFSAADEAEPSEDEADG